MLTTALSILALAALAGGCFYAVALALHRNNRFITRSVMREIRWWMLPLAMITFAATGLLTYLLKDVPILNWGWWRAVGHQSASVETSYIDYPGTLPVIIIVYGAVAISVPFICWVYEIQLRASLKMETASWGRRIGVALISGFPIVVFGGGFHMALAWGICHGGVATALYVRAYHCTQCKLRHATSQKAAFPERPVPDGEQLIRFQSVGRVHISSTAALGSAAFSALYFWIGTTAAIALALSAGSGMVP